MIVIFSINICKLILITNTKTSKCDRISKKISYARLKIILKNNFFLNKLANLFGLKFLEF